MRRPNRIAQVYGFTVCLLSLVAVASALTTLVDAAFKLSDPLRSGVLQGSSWLSADRPAEWPYGALTTFGHYREMRLRELRHLTRAEFEPDPAVPVRRPSTADSGLRPIEDMLHREFRELQTQAMVVRRFQAKRLLVGNFVLLTLATVVFATHWRWVNRLVLVDVGTGPLRAD